MLRDIQSKSQVTVIQAPSNQGSTATKSNLVDMSNKRGMSFVVATGVVTGADASNYVTPTLEECDTTADASFTAVAAGDVVGGVLPGALGANSVSRFSYIGSKRYVRVNFKRTGSGVTAYNACAIAVQETEEIWPTTNPAAIAAT